MAGGNRKASQGSVGKVGGAAHPFPLYGVFLRSYSPKVRLYTTLNCSSMKQKKRFRLISQPGDMRVLETPTFIRLSVRRDVACALLVSEKAAEKEGKGTLKPKHRYELQGNWGMKLQTVPLWRTRSDSCIFKSHKAAQREHGRPCF